MPALQKIRDDQIQVDRPLPFDVFDDSGMLLLRKGFVIDSAPQVERMLARGLFCSEVADSFEASVSAARHIASQHSAHKCSVFDLLSRTRHELEKQLAHPVAGEFGPAILRLAQQVQLACRLDADAAIANVFWAQDGRYAVRRMLHSGILVELILRELEEPEAQRRIAVAAALTMNMAMLDLQDRLYEQQEPLSPEQRHAVHDHPTQASDVLQGLGVRDSLWLHMVLHHHEAIDGSGYPHGISGYAVPCYVQVLALADRYGVLATGRAYRPPSLPNLVLRDIFNERGKAVDHQLVSHLINAVGIYPPGSLVELANGDQCIVVKRTAQAHQPVVRCVRTQAGERQNPPLRRLTHEPAYNVQRIIHLDQLDHPLEARLIWDEVYELDQ